MDSYFLAVTPPEDICSKIDVYRKKFSKFSSYQVAPHITIYPPFVLDSITESELRARLEESLRNMPSATVTTDSVGYFDNGSAQNAVFFKPDDVSTAYLTQLFAYTSKLLQDTTKGKYSEYRSETVFNPHMTIASHIPDASFEEIKERTRGINELFTFEAKTLDLYKQEGASGVWTKEKEILLGKTL
ncbi:MAG: hypothetical protein JWN50_712 [Parcubacteria group bacterium]|nr:hypothetical protein [Parcubacteria group bacterium]